MSILLRVLVIAAVTAALRMLPVLLLASNKKPLPPVVLYLSRVLPGAIVGLLVVYSLRGVALSKSPHGIPELVGVLVAGSLQYFKRNTLLSVFAATACYMVLMALM